MTTPTANYARRADVVGLATLLSGLMLVWVPAGVAQPVAAADTSATPTNGLIRRWPNPFDGVEHFSCAEGVVMGLLPPVAEEQEDAFRPEVGWMQLEPAFTNDAFSVACWVPVPLIAAPLVGVAVRVQPEARLSPPLSFTTTFRSDS